MLAMASMMDLCPCSTIPTALQTGLEMMMIRTPRKTSHRCTTSQMMRRGCLQRVTAARNQCRNLSVTRPTASAAVMTQARRSNPRLISEAQGQTIVGRSGSVREEQVRLYLAKLRPRARPWPRGLESGATRRPRTQGHWLQLLQRGAGAGAAAAGILEGSHPCTPHAAAGRWNTRRTRSNSTARCGHRRASTWSWASWGPTWGLLRCSRRRRGGARRGSMREASLDPGLAWQPLLPGRSREASSGVAIRPVPARRQQQRGPSQRRRRSASVRRTGRHRRPEAKPSSSPRNGFQNPHCELQQRHRKRRVAHGLRETPAWRVPSWNGLKPNTTACVQQLQTFASLCERACCPGMTISFDGQRMMESFVGPMAASVSTNRELDAVGRSFRSPSLAHHTVPSFVASSTQHERFCTIRCIRGCSQPRHCLGAQRAHDCHDAPRVSNCGDICAVLHDTAA